MLRLEPSLLLLLVRPLPALPGNRKSSKVVSLGKAELLATVPRRGPAPVLSASHSFWCSRNSRSPREAGWGAEATAGTRQGCGAPGASPSLPPPAFLPPGHSPGLCRAEKKRVLLPYELEHCCRGEAGWYRRDDCGGVHGALGPSGCS